VKATHFGLEVGAGIAVVTLTGAERKNPLTFESYAELRDTFRALATADDVDAVVFTGEAGNFSSGGDVHEIIGPLTRMDMDGICAGAGAAIATACDLRIGTPRAKVAFLFTRVGLAGADMGLCAMLPRVIGQGRAAELLFTGRSMPAEEGERWGFFNRLVEPEALREEALTLAAGFAAGPNFAHAMTKRMLDQEWDMSVDAAIEAEAQAQAICMQTRDFERAYRAFAEKRRPEFEGD
jgi:enoyl-CoA hydratase/carnithine racemase